jgi:plastocyanin
VFSAASKLYFTVAGMAVLAGALFVVATGDRAGFTLLVIAGVVAVVLGVGVFAFVAPDPVGVPAGAAGDAAADGSVPAVSTGGRPAGADDPPRPSIWPIVAAVSLAMVASGAALTKALVFGGLLVAFTATICWFGQVWREHPSWTEAMTDRLNDRFVTPIALPVLVIALVGVGVISFSRLLLAVDKEVATLVALVAAMAILGACAFVASRPRMGRAGIGALATFSTVTLIAAGVAGAIKGEREFEHHGAHGDVIHLVAHHLAFEVHELELRFGKVKVELENHDPPGVQHNLAILPETGGEAVFRGEVVDGGGKITYEFESPSPGKYIFRCDIHPEQMKGVVLVSPDTSAGPTPAAPPGR